MQKFKIFLGIILLFILSSSFYPIKKEEIKWLSFKELDEAYKKQPKPIIIDVYTSWCGWCKVMDKDTYSNQNVASYINEKYYAVKFNAESQEDELFSSKKYTFNKKYKSNELAIYLLRGQLSFPTTVLLPELNAQPQPIAGYLKPAQIEAPLKYFGDGAYKSQNFSNFSKSFSISW